jgi:hypothetical protein
LNTIVGICLAVLLPESPNARMLEENPHTSIPGFPYETVYVTGFIKQKLFRTEIEGAEKAFPFLGRQRAFGRPKLRLDAGDTENKLGQRC